jgi:hypothetical protein
MLKRKIRKHDDSNLEKRHEHLYGRRVGRQVTKALREFGIVSKAEFAQTGYRDARQLASDIAQGRVVERNERGQVVDPAGKSICYLGKSNLYAVLIVDAGNNNVDDCVNGNSNNINNTDITNNNNNNNNDNNTTQTTLHYNIQGYLKYDTSGNQYWTTAAGEALPHHKDNISNAASVFALVKHQQHHAVHADGNSNFRNRNGTEAAAALFAGDGYYDQDDDSDSDFNSSSADSSSNNSDDNDGDKEYEEKALLETQDNNTKKQPNHTHSMDPTEESMVMSVDDRTPTSELFRASHEAATDYSTTGETIRHSQEDNHQKRQQQNNHTKVYQEEDQQFRGEYARNHNNTTQPNQEAFRCIFSDSRLKHKITCVRSNYIRPGIHLYQFDWNRTALETFGLRGTEYGLMTSEIKQYYPECIRQVRGYEAVHIDVEQARRNEELKKIGYIMHNKELFNRSIAALLSS